MKPIRSNSFKWNSNLRHTFSHSQAVGRILAQISCRQLQMLLAFSLPLKSLVLLRQILKLLFLIRLIWRSTSHTTDHCVGIDRSSCKAIINARNNWCFDTNCINFCNCSPYLPRRSRFPGLFLMKFVFCGKSCIPVI